MTKGRIATTTKIGACKSTCSDADVTEIRDEDRQADRLKAKAAIRPLIRHSATAMAFSTPMVGGDCAASLVDVAEVVSQALAKTDEGNLRPVSQMLMLQAISLDSIFTELVRRSGANMGEYLDASERYMRLALKAQGNCRATLETLSKLHQPREQTVRHVHINEGGQAVVADNLHYHTGERRNAKSDEQPHATGALGAGPSLPCPDSFGKRVSVSGREGETQMQNARGEKSRRARRQY